MTRKALIMFLLLVVWTDVPPVSMVCAQETDAEVEYKLKAAFLLNFAKFINWPEGTFAGDEQPFKVCVLGESPFGSTLATIESRTVANRKVNLHYVNTLQEAVDCHLLFVSASEKNNLANINAALDDHAITTVSDIKGFARDGGIIEFITREDKLAFTINLRRAREQELNIHSALLNLAQEVIQ